MSSVAAFYGDNAALYDRIATVPPVGRWRARAVAALDLDAGDTVTVSGPFGRNYYEGERRVVVLAGGPGIGPAVAIAERALGEDSEAAIVYRDDAPVHEDRLADIAAAGADVFVLTGEEPLTDATAAALSGADGEQTFVYGFSDFLANAEAAIEATGLDPDAAKAENFG